MTNYRRNFIPGGSYFFTVNLADRRLRLLDRKCRLCCDWRFATRGRGIRSCIEAIVVLPDHLHAIWRLPEGDRDFTTRWRLIKSAFSRGLAARRADFEKPSGEGRAGNLAAALLGARAARRSAISRATSIIFISIR